MPKLFRSKLLEAHKLDEPIVTGKPSKNIFKNRYIRLIVCTLACLCTTLFYLGWQDCQRMLYKERAFEWLCSPDEIAQRESSAYKCNNLQYTRIQNLYTIATSAEFSSALIAGFLTDTIGPLLTSFLGNAIYLLSWIIIMVSGEAFPAYWLGFLLMGLSVNLIAFPCLELEELFPNRRRLVISTVVAAQTGGSMIAPIMNSILKTNESLTFTGLMTIYLLCIALPIFVLSMLCHPVKRIIVLKEAFENKELMTYDIESNKAVGTEIQKNNKIGQIELDTLKVENMSYKLYIKKCLKQVSQLDYLLFLVYFVISVSAHGYYLSIVDYHFEKEVGEFHGYFFPTQIIWGILFGYVTDYSGTLIICEILSFAFILSIVLASFYNYALQYISSVIFIIANGYIYIVKYTYLSETYAGDTFQVLVGLMGFFAGMVQLINYALEGIPNHFQTIYIVYASLVAITVCFLIVLQIRRKKNYSKC